MLGKLTEYRIILGSQSPRRKELLKALDIDFEVMVKDGIEEVFPSGLSKENIALHLAEIKSKAYDSELDKHTIVITADTIVWKNGIVMNKPRDYNEAVAMLKKLSNGEHFVITGVCLRSEKKQKSFYSSTKVVFKELSFAEIDYYVTNYKPYDKAGAYGIQEWIGYTGIKHIEGSYFNVVGLPVQKLYDELFIFSETLPTM